MKLSEKIEQLKDEVETEMFALNDLEDGFNRCIEHALSHEENRPKRWKNVKVFDPKTSTFAPVIKSVYPEDQQHVQIFEHGSDKASVAIYSNIAGFCMPSLEDEGIVTVYDNVTHWCELNDVPN